MRTGRCYWAQAWRGVDSDLREALEVSGWAESLWPRSSAGIGTGRAEIRHTLLHGGMDVLDELANITASLERPEHRGFHQCSDGESPISDPDELYALANRAEALADRAR